MIQRGAVPFRDTNDASRIMRYTVISACGFLYCQSDRSGTEYASPSNTMAQRRTAFGTLIAIGIILIFPYQIVAQPSTAPPSSLSTMPLVHGTLESEIRTSCDLCRKPEGKPGSDLQTQRLRREKGLRPRKQAKGTHRSFDQSLKSALPHHPLPPSEDLPTETPASH